MKKSHLILLILLALYLGGCHKKSDSALVIGNWNYLLSSDSYSNASVSGTVTITRGATNFYFFGMYHRERPSPSWDDGGYDCAILLRGSDNSGYRFQISTALQEIALVKYPTGGYLRAVSYPLSVGQSYSIQATAYDNVIQLIIDGTTVIEYTDLNNPITSGVFTIGEGFGSETRVSGFSVGTPPQELTPSVSISHQPNFSVRNWLGETPWIFDGDEPILMLPSPAVS